ncbi:MAG: hypothetical protein GX329_03590 [Tissierellia bacterium]|nr:hypothetical protein [Tissierellia bacterium]
MDYRHHRSNDSKKNRRMVVASIILIYILFRVAPSLSAVRYKTILPEYRLVEDRIETEAMIIKKEYVYKAHMGGMVEILAEEGEKVGKDVKIARLISVGDEIINQDLKDIDEKIETLMAVRNGEHEGNSESDIPEDTLIDQSLEALEEERKQIVERMAHNTTDYVTQQSGIISFMIDGYEELYSFNHIESYKPSDIRDMHMEPMRMADGDAAEAGDPLFKVIDNFEWYMIINIDNIDVNSYDEGDYIWVSSRGKEDGIRGRIERINKEGDKSLILGKFNIDFEKYYDKRYIEIDVIQNSREGYEIPTRCIVEKDGVEGVYVKDIGGIVKFKPIKILLQEDRTTYIDFGDEGNNIYIEGDDMPYETISGLDEILLYTMGIKEGMIIN